MLEITGATSVNAYGDTMNNLIRSNSDPDFPWLGALVGSAIIGFWYWCTDQYIVQRVLSGRIKSNPGEVRFWRLSETYSRFLVFNSGYDCICFTSEHVV